MITQKLLNRFSQNAVVERWHAHGPRKKTFLQGVCLSVTIISGLGGGMPSTEFYSSFFTITRGCYSVFEIDASIKPLETIHYTKRCRNGTDDG